MNFYLFLKKIKCACDLCYCRIKYFELATTKSNPRKQSRAIKNSKCSNKTFQPYQGSELSTKYHLSPSFFSWCCVFRGRGNCHGPWAHLLHKVQTKNMFFFSELYAHALNARNHKPFALFLCLVSINRSQTAQLDFRIRQIRFDNTYNDIV